MAPTKEAQTTEADDKTQMLKEALKCVNGNLDFEKLAAKMGVANGEAMRKRFKRFFEKDDDPIQIKGNTLGAIEEGAAPPKTPRTPRAKAAKSTGDGDAAAAAEDTTKAAGKKRGATDISKDESTTEGDGAGSDEATDDKAVKTPAKKARATKAPATPKVPKSPKTPRAPRTPKSTAAKKATKPTVNGNDAGTADSNDAEIGSPAIQAKTDAAVKEAEEANGVTMGEPAQQAKHDAVEMAMRGDSATT